MSFAPTSLLGYYRQFAGPPPHLTQEARGWGLEIRDPVREHWETVSDFLTLYSAEAGPAGVLVLASDPGVGGSLSTGIPLTDPVRAARHLNLPARAAATAGGAVTLAASPGGDGPADPASERFWTIVGHAKRRTGGTLEGLFAGVHLANAFPFALLSGREPAALARYLSAMPLYRQACERHVDALVRMLRPQVIACIGRLAYEAVAKVAENRLELAADLAERGWEGLVLQREYADGPRAFPRGEFPGFRAYLVPVAGLDEPDGSQLAGHAHDTLERLLVDAWT